MEFETTFKRHAHCRKEGHKASKLFKYLNNWKTKPQSIPKSQDKPEPKYNHVAVAFHSSDTLRVFIQVLTNYGLRKCSCQTYTQAIARCELKRKCNLVNILFRGIHCCRRNCLKVFRTRFARFFFDVRVYVCEEITYIFQIQLFKFDMKFKNKCKRYLRSNKVLQRKWKIHSFAFQCLLIYATRLLFIAHFRLRKFSN